MFVLCVSHVSEPSDDTVPEGRGESWGLVSVYPYKNNVRDQHVLATNINSRNQFWFHTGDPKSPPRKSSYTNRDLGWLSGLWFWFHTAEPLLVPHCGSKITTLKVIPYVWVQSQTVFGSAVWNHNYIPERLCDYGSTLRNQDHCIVLIESTRHYMTLVPHWGTTLVPQCGTIRKGHIRFRTILQFPVQ